MPTIVPCSVPSNIALQTGPILLGNLLAYGLYGILVVQVCVYYHAFPTDNKWIKCTVLVTFIVDTVMTVSGSVAAWRTLADGWGNLASIENLNWAFVILPFLTALVATVVHLFYSWRIWRLSQCLIMPVIINIISIFSFVTATFSGFQADALGLARIHGVRPWVIMWLSSSLVVDLMITVLMTKLLFKAKASTPLGSTSSALSKLITVTVETGLTVTVGASVQLCLFILYNTRDLHFLPFVLPKLYSNTLLATFNTRLTISAKHHGAMWQSTSGTVDLEPLCHTFERHTKHRPNVSSRSGVKVSTMVEQHDDNGTSVRNF